MEFSFTNIAIMVGVGFVALVILGAIVERQEKVKARKAEEEEEKAEAERERLEKICPQCHAEDAIKRSRNRVDYRLIGKVNEMVLIESPIQYSEATGDKYRVTDEVHYTCKYCDYTRTERKESEEIPIRDGDIYCTKCYWGTLHWRDTKELDRYQAPKAVEEKTAQGKTKTRNVKCTKVVEEYLFGCDECDFTTTATITRELD